MSKSSKPARRRTRRPARALRERAVDVMTQLEVAARRPSAALFGALLGGAVPWFARKLAHEEVPAAWAQNRVLALVMLAIVLGCAAFSMLTVYKFGLAAFGDRRKAIGFVAALEGVMLVSHGTTSAVALAMLVAINAIANGCVIALNRDATLRRQEADQRRAATRAQNRRDRAGVRSSAPATAPAGASVTTPTAPTAPDAAPRRRSPSRPSPIVVVHAPAGPRRPALADGDVQTAEFQMLS